MSEDGVLLRRADGTILRWSEALRPLRGPHVDGIVGFSRSDHELRMLTARDVFDGIVRSRCRIWSLPEAPIEQVGHGDDLYVLDAEGTVWHGAAGSNDHACRDSPASAIRLDYVRVPGLRRARQLAGGPEHVCVLDERGAVVCIDPDEPAAGSWSMPLDRSARDVSAGSSGVCAIDDSGRLVCAEPFTMERWMHEGPERFVALDADLDQTCALTDEGSVLCVREQLAGDQRLDSTAIALTSLRLPPSTRFAMASSYDGRTLACTASAEDEVVCVHEEDPERSSYERTRLHTLDELTGGLVALDESRRMRCILDTTRALRCWTRPDHEQDDAEETEEALPAEALHVPPPPGEILRLVVEDLDVCVQLADESLRCATPAPDGAEVAWRTFAEDVRDVARNDDALCVVSGDEGELRCHGRLQVGRGAITFDPTTALRLGRRAIAASSIALGASHLCVAFEGGRVACLGEGRDGQLGLGSAIEEARVLREVPGISEVHRLIAGPSWTCVERSGGETHCWGDETTYHPMRQEQLEGARLVAFSDPWGMERCLLDRELVCTKSDERILLAPWEERPRVEIDANGMLSGYSWIPGAVPLLCEEPLEETRPLVTTCYVDAPLPARAAIDPERRIYPSMVTTPEDLPRYPGARPASARMYAFESGRRSDCDEREPPRAIGERCGGRRRLGGGSLTRAELGRVLDATNDVNAYARGVRAHCFDPHHEIVFSDAEGSELGVLSICFECGSMIAWPHLGAQDVADTNLQPAHADFQAICRRLRLPLCDP